MIGVLIFLTCRLRLNTQTPAGVLSQCSTSLTHSVRLAVKRNRGYSKCTRKFDLVVTFFKTWEIRSSMLPLTLQMVRVTEKKDKTKLDHKTIENFLGKRRNRLVRLSQLQKLIV